MQKVVIDEGLDLTTILKIVKYIPKQSGGVKCQFGTMQQKGSFPSDKLSKTDETNIQGCVSFLDEIKGKSCYLSVKADGSSHTSLYLIDVFSVCTRNHNIKNLEDNKFWQVAKKYDLERILANFKNYAIQGELVAPGIQKNKLEVTEPEIRVFNIIDLEKRQRIPIHEALRFCEKWNIPHVEVIEFIDSFNYTLKDLIAKTYRTYPNTQNQVEGLVLRTQEYCFSKRMKGDSSAKIMCPEYKL